MLPGLPDLLEKQSVAFDNVLQRHIFSDATNKCVNFLPLKIWALQYGTTKV